MPDYKLDKIEMPSSGLLNINKPKGVTSYWVVGKVKKILETAKNNPDRIKKVGHCGTLDPMAEGVLIVLFGSATRLQSMIMDQPKVYRTKVLLGVSTDTGDITGRILSEKTPPPVSNSSVLEILDSFKGEITQLTPLYSAMKYRGKKMYEYARAGVEIPRPPRIVNIYKIELLNVSDNIIDFRVECSGGTYIRSLGEDIGSRLGCGATLEYLCREKIGGFDISSAIDGKDLDKYSREQLLNMASGLDIFNNMRR